MPKIPHDALRALWPHADESLVTGISSPESDAVLERLGIVSPVQLCHFISQISHECGAGTEMVENLNYSAQGLIRTWPSRFNQSNAGAYAHQPQRIADAAYNGRMGNRVETDDGWNYRGRGGTQCTGREGYEKLAKLTGLDLLNHPELVNDPKNFVLCSAEDFIVCGCLPYATATPEHPKGDVVMVTRRLNGGLIGLSERQAWFARWWTKVYGA